MEVIEQWKEEKVVLAQLEQQKKELQNTLNNTKGLSSPQIEFLGAQIQNIDNQINDSKSKITLASTKSNILASTAASLDLGVTSNPTTNTVATIESQKRLALESYTRNKAELEKRGSSYVEVQELKNTYFPIHGSLVLNENALATNNNDTAYKIDQIKQMLASDLPQITNQTKKTALEKTATELITALEKTLNKNKAELERFSTEGQRPGPK
jgi:hypothetical protein